MAVPQKMPDGPLRDYQNQLNELQKKYTDDSKDQKAKQKEEEEQRKRKAISKKTTVVLQPQKWESNDRERKTRRTL